MFEPLPPTGGTVWEGGEAWVVEPCWRKLLVTKSDPCGIHTQPYYSVCGLQI